MPVVIREDREQYMQELRDWLEQERDVPLEEMADFFHRRIDTYEEKMQTWKAAMKNRRLDRRGYEKDAGSGLRDGAGTGIHFPEISPYPCDRDRSVRYYAGEAETEIPGKGYHTDMRGLFSGAFWGVLL